MNVTRMFVMAVVGVLLLAGCATVSEDTAGRMERGVRTYTFYVEDLLASRQIVGVYGRDGVVRFNDLHPVFRNMYPHIPALTVFVARSDVQAANFCSRSRAGSPLATAAAFQSGQVPAGSTRCGSLAPYGHPWIAVSATRWDENGEPFGFTWDDADVRHELGHALGGERHWGDGGPDR